MDPITLEVIRNSLTSVADEMIAALVRSSYSTNIKDRRDASCAVYGPGGDLIAQSEIGTPLHLGTMYSAIPTAMGLFPFSNLEPGDAVAFNLPHPSGPGHLNDLTLISPVSGANGRVGIVANQAHHVDMGGFAPGSMPFGVTEIYQEGLQIPPVRLFKTGNLDEELWSVIQHNIRTPNETLGDLMAQYAANMVGISRYAEICDKYGFPLLQHYMGELQAYSRRRMQNAISKVKPGVYEFEDVIEGDGIVDHEYKIHVKLSVDGNHLIADFSESDDTALGPLNCRWPSVAASVFYTLKAVLDPDIPPNTGAYDAFEIILRDNSLLSAEHPSAVCNSNIITTQRIVDVLLGALAQAIPGQVLAACAGTMNIINIGAYDPNIKEYFNFVETYGGGQGARIDCDGMSGIQHHMTNTRNAPVESIEIAYPILVKRYGLVPNSEGPGKHRGGFGICRELQILCDEVRMTIGCDRKSRGPWGLFGGASGRQASCFIRAIDGSERDLPSKSTVQIGRNETVVNETPGGGGWGDPLDREPSAVARDVRGGLISVERAARLYGVIVDPESMDICTQETEETRAVMRDVLVPE